MDFLERLQKLPENKKKIILWGSVLVLAFFLFAWYFKMAGRIMGKYSEHHFLREELKIPLLEGKVKELMGKFGPDDKQLKTLEESIKNLEKNLPKENQK